MPPAMPQLVRGMCESAWVRRRHGKAALQVDGKLVVAMD